MFGFLAPANGGSTQSVIGPGKPGLKCVGSYHCNGAHFLLSVLNSTFIPSNITIINSLS